ncbi:MAG: hypothetical protein U0822_14510 [Anaerolineae bacterium]
MTRLCFAILAHDKPDCLQDQVQNIRAFAPNADIVLFNGGRDAHLADGIDIDVCPYSQPFGYARVARYHYEVMRWLHEEKRGYDFLITVDSDVLLIKPGLDAYLERVMADHAYMAVLFREITPQLDWVPGQTFMHKWEGIWQPIFGTRYPYGCFNPGQVFRREYAERLMRFPKLDELLTRIDRSRIQCLEEIVWSTMGVTLGCSPRDFPAPNDSAIRYLVRHSPSDVRRWLSDPSVFLLHPITMDMDAPERRLIRALRDGQTVDYPRLQEEFDAYQEAPPAHKRWQLSVLKPVFARLHNAYLRVVPE